MEKIIVEPELLESLYLGNSYPDSLIAGIFDCGETTIYDRRKRYSIPSWIDYKIVIEPEILRGLCLGNGYDVMQIANMFDCCEDAVYNRMKKYGIPTQFNHKLTGFTFNARQKEIFEGCMLGDGGLKWRGNNCHFSNYDKHKEYLVWLQRVLGVKDISRVGYDSDMGYVLRTKVIPSIRDEHKRWYPYKTKHGTMQGRNNKVIPKDIELTPVNVLFWYIGDGTYIKEYKSARFTNHFDFDDWGILSNKLCDLFNVDSSITIAKSGKDTAGNQIYCLNLSKAVTNKFFDMVDDLDFNIPECYQYKFGKEKPWQNEN